jgi:hypothetical protein
MRKSSSAAIKSFLRSKNVEDSRFSSVSITRSSWYQIPIKRNILALISEIMKLLFSIVSVVALASCAQAYNLPTSRRDVFTKAAAVAFVPAVVAFVPAVAQAMDACPPKSTNCIRTTWTPPAGTNKAGAAKAVKTLLNNYPQGGTSFCLEFNRSERFEPLYFISCRRFVSVFAI